MIKNSKLIRHVESYGFKLVRSKRHMIFAHPCGARLVTAQSASDHRAIKNVERDIKHLLERHGIKASAVSV